jgi:hypothetical protein
MPKRRNLVEDVKFPVPNNSTAYKKIVKIIVAIIFIVSLSYFFFTNLHSKALTDALSHQPEKYTELFFTNANDLPTTISEGQILPIYFTIHNVESETTTYTYSIVFTSSTGGTTLLTSGLLTLGSNGSSNLVRSISLPAFSGRGEVGVVLKNQPETIHFWVEASAI